MIVNQKVKIFFSLLFAGIIISGSYFLPVLDFDSLKKGGREIYQKIKKEVSVFAWEMKPYVFVHYHQRIKYLIDEMTSLSEDLVQQSNDFNQLLEECDCSNVQTQCLRKAGGIGIVSGSLVSLEKESSTPSLATKIEEEFEKIEEKFEKLKPEGTIKDLKDNLNSLKEELLPDLKNELKNLSPSIKGNAEENIKNIEKNIENTLKNLKEYPKDLEDQLKKAKKDLEKQFKDLFKNLKKAVDISAKIKELQKKIKDSFTEITNDLKQILSVFPRCSAVGVFGDPCSENGNREKINAINLKMKEKGERIAYLRGLLEKEIVDDLPRVMAALGPEEGQILKDNLENLLAKSQEIIKESKKGEIFATECLARKCTGHCDIEYFFSIKACVATGTGEQKPIILKFKVGVSLDDLELGKVGIKNINLGLPEKIKMPSLGELGSFTIAGPRIKVTFPEKPFEKKAPAIKFQIPTAPSLPKLPAISLSCPPKPKQKTSILEKWCEKDIALFGKKEIKPLKTITDNPTTNGKEAIENVDYNWYFQTFAWLSQKCQELPGIKDDKGIPTEKIGSCFDINKVASTIVKECDVFWKTYYSSESELSIPPICQSLGKPCLEKEKAKERECQNLFNQEKETIPSDCSLNIQCTADYDYCDGTEDCYATEKSIQKVVETLKNKCDQLRKNNRKEPSEPCKFLSLFTEKLESPGTIEYSGPEQASGPQTKFSYPSGLPGCGWFPTIPKICLPDLIIPDIIMPELYLPPLICLKLPSFIFEDLILPDIKLCNIDDCKDIWPQFKLQLPMIRIPEIKIPPIELGLAAGIPLPDIEIEPLKIPAFPFKGLGLPKLGDLLIPELQLPSIPLPKPKFTFSFEGIDTSTITSLISTFILNALGIPDRSLCIGFDLKSVCCYIALPDYEFHWPFHISFPDLEIPFCKDVNKFCKKIKKALGEEDPECLENCAKGCAFNPQADKCIKEECKGKTGEEKLRCVAECIRKKIKKALEEDPEYLENCPGECTFDPQVDKCIKEECKGKTGEEKLRCVAECIDKCFAECDKQCKGLLGKIREIEKIYNETIFKEIQEPLDKMSKTITKEIEKNIHQNLDKIAQDLKKDIERHIRENAPEPLQDKECLDNCTGECTFDPQVDKCIKEECKEKTGKEKVRCTSDCLHKCFHECDEKCKIIKIPPFEIKLPDITIPGFSLDGMLQEKCKEDCPGECAFDPQVDKCIKEECKEKTGKEKVRCTSDCAHKCLEKCDEKCEKEGGLPKEITLPWPASLKKIILAKEITYKLPTIPLSRILCINEEEAANYQMECDYDCAHNCTKRCEDKKEKEEAECVMECVIPCWEKCKQEARKIGGCGFYEKEFEVRLPGFQPRTLTLALDLPGLGNVECHSRPGSGGNPCPTSKSKENLSQIENLNKQIQESLQKIDKIF